MSATNHSSRSRNSGDDVIEVEPTVLAEPEPEYADSLISTNDPDDLANEQTWPTEEEMKGLDRGEGEASLPDAKAGTTPKRIKRIPKGMSEYQAAWIVDSEEDDDEGDREDSESGTASKDAEGLKETEAPQEEEMAMDELIELESRKSVVAFQDLDVEEETQQCVFHEKLISLCRLDLSYVRGLRNGGIENERKMKTHSSLMRLTRRWTFRPERGFKDTEGYDRSEQVLGIRTKTFHATMREYSSSRISNGRRGVRSERLRKDPAWRYDDFLSGDFLADRLCDISKPGVRVTVHIKNVPREASCPNPGAPLVIFGLLKHEHKKTVLNFTVQRNTEYEGSVRSKVGLHTHLSVREILTIFTGFPHSMYGSTAATSEPDLQSTHQGWRKGTEQRSQI
jgi:pre-rRNA-processing protein TSR1